MTISVSIVCLLLGLGLCFGFVRMLFWIEAVHKEFMAIVHNERASLERFTEKILSDVGLANMHSLERMRSISTPSLQVQSNEVSLSAKDEFAASGAYVMPGGEPYTD